MACTTDVKNSTFMAMYVGGTKVARQTEAGYSITFDERDVTTKDIVGNFNETIPGLGSGTMNVSGLVAETGFGDQDLLTLAKNRTVSTCRFGDGVSDVTVDAWISSLDVSSPGAEQNVVFNATLKMCGPPS